MRHPFATPGTGRHAVRWQLERRSQWRFLRSRTGGQYSLVFYWKGKKVIKALGTRDRREAEQIKKDAEEQLARISQGDSRAASRLLAEGFSIVEVLFGSPEIAARLDWESDHNPLTVAELCKGYLGHLKPIVGFDQAYNTESWLKRIRKVLGDDRRVMSLASSDAEHFARLRAKSVGNPTVKKEIGSLKAAISWAVDEGLLKSNPIKRWPKIKVKRPKPFMWKSEIEAIIDSHNFENDAERAEFLVGMKMRMVLTQEDIKQLIALARQKAPPLVIPLMVACSAGIRRKELVLLKKQDFDPVRGTITVGSEKQSRFEEITYRVIALPDQVADVLRAHHAALPPAEKYLFPIFGEINLCYNNRWVHWETTPEGDTVPKRDRKGKSIPKERKLSESRRRAEKAGRELDKLIKGTEFELMNGWHCLRHSFISMCVAKGLTWEQIAEWAGHVSRATTKLYTHFNVKDSKERIEALGITF